MFKLYMEKGIALLIGTLQDTKVHKHHAIQIILGVENQYKLVMDKTYEGVDLSIITSDVPHQFIGDGEYVFLLIEPESKVGELLKPYIHTPVIQNKIDKKTKLKIKALIRKDEKNIDDYVHFIFSLLNIDYDYNKEIDERIKQAIYYIEELEFKKIDVETLASKVNLSVSRLQHLFKEQVGIPIKRYLLWKKMIDGINNISKDYDFTRAAHEAGFADAAHMSRTFREMFGLSLSEVFKTAVPFKFL